MLVYYYKSTRSQVTCIGLWPPRNCILHTNVPGLAVTHWTWPTTWRMNKPSANCDQLLTWLVQNCYTCWRQYLTLLHKCIKNGYQCSVNTSSVCWISYTSPYEAWLKNCNTQADKVLYIKKKRTIKVSLDCKFNRTANWPDPFTSEYRDDTMTVGVCSNAY